MPIRPYAVLATALSLAAGAATAATMNFETLPDEGAMLKTYSENGITATAIDDLTLGWFTEPGVAHIDDSGTGFTKGADFTMSGLFDAVGFKIVSNGYFFLDTPPSDPPPTLMVSGFLGGNLVSSTSFLVSSVIGKAQSFLLGSAFAGLDTLRIELRSPFGQEICDAPCVHFDLDSVTLNPTSPAPVPLPATALLSGAGLLALLGMGLTRRKG
jgi:hypothetical protein